MWTKEFWRDTAERAIYTFAEAMLGFMAVSYKDIDWPNALCVSGAALLVTIFKCIVTQAIADKKNG